MKRMAILVDGGFYRKRARYLWGSKSATDRATELISYCRGHLTKEHSDLYRIFYYDCPPMSRTVYHPWTKRNVDFRRSDTFTWTNEFLEILKAQRKVALRLGELSEGQAHFRITGETLKHLCAGTKRIEDLVESDFSLDVKQKGVDMKIGIDISSLSYKRQVDQIVLVAGDSDFVPAAKLARREGIDFILDPMWAKIKDDLYEHIDGLFSPQQSSRTNQPLLLPASTSTSNDSKKEVR